MKDFDTENQFDLPNYFSIFEKMLKNKITNIKKL